MEDLTTIWTDIEKMVENLANPIKEIVVGEPSKTDELAESIRQRLMKVQQHCRIAVQVSERQQQTYSKTLRQQQRQAPSSSTYQPSSMGQTAGASYTGPQQSSSRSAPVGMTSAPAGLTSVSAGMTSAPIGMPSAPVGMPSAPVGMPSGPVGMTNTWYRSTPPIHTYQAPATSSAQMHIPRIPVGGSVQQAGWSTQGRQFVSSIDASNATLQSLNWQAQQVAQQVAQKAHMYMSSGSHQRSP